MHDEKSLTQSQALAIFRKIVEEEEEIQARLDKIQDEMISRFISVTNESFGDLKQQLLRTIRRLDTENGEVLRSQKNLAMITRDKKRIKRITDQLLAFGVDYFFNEGVEIQQQSQEEFLRRQKILAASGIKMSFEFFNENALKTAARQSIRVYNDAVGSLAKEISALLIRQLLVGTSRARLIDDYERIVPAIDKPKRGGGRFRLSARARAMMTIRTETIRLFGQTAHDQNKKIFGPDYMVMNFNPLDERTDTILCFPATEQSPMTNTRLLDQFGLPGRHPNCRCSIGAVHPVIMSALPPGTKP